MQIYTASITPAGLRTAGEVSDGTLLIGLWSSDRRRIRRRGGILTAVPRRASRRDLDGFDLAPYVKISMGNDSAACRDALRPNL